MASPADKSSRDNDKAAPEAASANKGSTETGASGDAKRAAAGGKESGGASSHGSQTSPSPTPSSGASGSSPPSTGAAFVQRLRDRHRALRDVLDGRATQSAKPREIAKAFAAAWLPFDRVEAGVMQRALNASGDGAEALAEAEVRTDLLNFLLANLLEGMDADKAGLDALAEQFAGLAKLAERCEGGLLQAIDSMPEPSRLPLSQLEARYESARRRFERLDDDAIGEAMEMLAPRRLSVPAPRQQRQSEYDMPRNSSQMRDRDDQGRFLPEDERDYGRSGRRGSTPERDESGRFMSDDERRSRSRYDDDDNRGRRYMGRNEDDDRRSSSSRDRGHGGWFGDSEGHSEASRRGWENSDHGQSGWYGDREGHSEASRRGWERPDHGESGWFGDREGHSEASRRGWDEGHRSQSRDDDNRRSRYEDDRRSYAAGRGERYEDNERSSRGHSGWSGDPEGHSEASRRGWERRR